MNPRALFTLTLLAAACSKSHAPIAAEPAATGAPPRATGDAPSLVTASSDGFITPPPTPSVTHAAPGPDPASSPGASKPCAERATPDFSAIDTALNGGTTQDAFGALERLGAIFRAAGVPAEAFCYQALADYDLNQSAAGGVDAGRCTAAVPAAKKADWEKRLAAARTSADQRQEAILRRAIASGCESALNSSPVPVGGGCATCIKASDFAESMRRDAHIAQASKPALDEARNALMRSSISARTVVKP